VKNNVLILLAWALATSSPALGREKKNAPKAAPAAAANDSGPTSEQLRMGVRFYLGASF
jgi:hypothetical protein